MIVCRQQKWGFIAAILFCCLEHHAAVPPPPPSTDQGHLNDFLSDRQFTYQIAIITAASQSNPTSMQTAEQLHQSPDYAELFIQSKRDWANYQGYDYIHNVIETDLTDVPERITANSNTIVPSTIRNSSQQIIPLALIKQSADWLKIDLLRQHLPRYDWVCWLDMDTLVVDMQVELQSFIRQAIRHRPQLDLVIEGSPVEYRNLNGRSLRTGVMIFRNSVWTQRLLAQASDLLSDPEWSQLAGEALTRRSDESSLADALVVLLNDERQFKGSDAHLYFMKLQDWWDQNLLYLPRIGILHFRNCLESDSRCLRVLRAAVEHLLHGEQFYIYQAAPYVQHIYNIFVVIYVFFSIDRLYHIVGRWRKRKPQLKCNLPAADSNANADVFPLVVVQLPMFNEKSCCQTIIDCACRLDWPRDRLLIQVVDDSTCQDTRQLVDERAAYWKRRGVCIEVCRRTHRLGFKAGAMNEAMDRFRQPYEFICIFDSDFLPQPQFLRQTIPYLMAAPKAAFVQTTWVYTNAKESLLTRMQEISLNFHFYCEQESRFRLGKFFNFNGTAGVWRAEAIRDSGGWEMDTLVEDMDLSLRAWAKGWHFIYLRDVCCANEIPPTFDAYRGQQHRWTSGPMQVLKKAVRPVATSKHLSVGDKLFCLWFFMRNYVHVVNFLYFLVLIPLMIWIPRVTLSEWAVIYLPAAISISNILFTPSEWYHVLHYILFENAMCLYKTGALISGILNIGKARHWTVTPKFARKTMQATTAAVSTDRAKQSTTAENLLSFSMKPMDNLSTDFLVNDTPSASPIPSNNSSSLTLPELIPTEGDGADEQVELLVVPSSTSINSNNNIDNKSRLIPIASAYFNNRSRLLSRIKFHPPELLMSMFLSVCAYYGFLMNQTGIATFSLLNALAYVILGFGLMGKIL